MYQLSFDDLLPQQKRKKQIEVLKVFELFAGYGSQSLALNRFNIHFDPVGYCEIDKYAIQAYKALHGDHIKNYGDITKVNVDELPNMNLLTYSFPCQDISVAGKQRGLSKDSGTRSSLLWECHRIIEAKRPEYLMMENVKNLVGKQNVPDFQAWLDTLTLLGYNNYWKIVNAKHCGVPQNRERVFCVSIRQDIDDGLFRFEEPFDNGIRLKHILETEVDEKYYLSKKTLEGFNTHNTKHKEKGTGFIWKPKNENDIANTLRANASLCPTDNTIKIIGHSGTGGERGYIYDANGISSCLSATDYKQPKQIFYQIPRGKNKGGYKENCTTITKNSWEHNNFVVENLEKKEVLRRLTPRECGRLMGLTDQEIDKIQSADISNSQQYKMFGNSIVVDAMKFLKNINGGYE